MDMMCGTLTVLNLRLVIQSGSGVSMIQQGLLGKLTLVTVVIVVTLGTVVIRGDHGNR